MKVTLNARATGVLHLPPQPSTIGLLGQEMLAWHEYVPNADTQVRLTGMVQRAAADVGGAGREINNDDTAVS